MKKITNDKKKISLDKVTIRQLDSIQLGHVAGGGGPTGVVATCSCRPRPKC
jgi:hypothetical protein